MIIPINMSLYKCVLGREIEIHGVSDIYPGEPSFTYAVIARTNYGGLV